MKRIFDFILSVCGILLSSPFWIIIAWGIWLNDLGSVFYFQERVGKDGNIFKSIQFRSMVKDAENSLGPIQAKERDPRITKLGRIFRATAMDELPQLLNSPNHAVKVLRAGKQDSTDEAFIVRLVPKKENELSQ